MKKISVITICYNEPNLEQTCDSIVNQTFQDFEWIVIDGGSNEETQKIWDKYKYRIDKFVSEKDNGIYDACNKGIKLASGEYLNFMNAGDSYYSTNVLAEILPWLEPKNDVVYGNSYNIYPANPKMNGLLKFPSNIDKNFFICGNLNTQTVFVKKKLFQQYGSFKLKYKICADHERWLKFISENKKFIGTSIIVANYDREGLSSITNYDNEVLKMQRHYFKKKVLYKKKNIQFYTPIEQIFSIKNSVDKTHKIITILGVHIKLKRRK